MDSIGEVSLAARTPQFDAEFRERLRDLLKWRRDVRRFKRSKFPEGTIERLIEMNDRGRSLDLQLWTLITFELWCRRFIDEGAFCRAIPTAARRNIRPRVERARAGRDGRPGVIAFTVESLDVRGIPVPLNANLTLAAPDVAAQAAKISNPSVVHVSGALPRGEEAIIEPGMPLTAIVTADTPLR